MKEIVNLQVKYHGADVGTLAENKSGQIVFQYNKEWLEQGFSISPLSLPLESRVFVPEKMVFEGLYGVFADSLPDGWGRLLVDRLLLEKGYRPEEIRPIVRLGIVGSSGMGALEYVPEFLQNEKDTSFDFDHIAHECEKILNEEKSDNLDTLFALGGSSGGARPKVLVSIDGEDWIVKFPSSYDRKSIGAEEYAYMQCAKKCGICIPEVKLFPSETSQGYFGAKRFDRLGHEKIHMITASGLLETSHRIPNLDYCDLMKLTYVLTKDEEQLEEMYRRMCFNVWAHNRDDHSKNFSYQYIESKQSWRLTPVYDLTYSSSIGGEHATCVNGNGKNPGMKELIDVGKLAGINEKRAKIIASDIKEIVYVELKEFLKW